MLYRQLGESGLRVSELSLGSWLTFGGSVGEETARACITAAYERGVNFFDNAEAYAGGMAEVVVGNVLKEVGWPRESLVLSTKIFWGGQGPNETGLSHKRVIEGVHLALRRLQTEYIDLVFCHRPDPHTPIEETVRAMDILVRQGKIFYWGTSEWSASDIIYADHIARRYGFTPPRMEQPQYNMFSRERVEKEYFLLASKLGYGLTIWSPLASGVLSGKYQKGIPSGSRLGHKENAWLAKMALTPSRLEKVEKLDHIAKNLGCSLAQLAIAWCLKNSYVSSVITGATGVAQVKENMGAISFVEALTSEVMQQIEKILSPFPHEVKDS